jgi:multimeric flavodoxin WrbA
MTKAIIVLGSSRGKGETWHAIQEVIGNQSPIPLIDLNDLSISPYDYEHSNQNDDYIPLIEKLVAYDLIVLATPVYWYTMSAQMKIFIDHLSDLLEIRKDLGRKLRGKKIFILASFSTSLPKGFEDAFSQTCDYMGMEYLGCSFIYRGMDPALLKMKPSQIALAKNVMG